MFFGTRVSYLSETVWGDLMGDKPLRLNAAPVSGLVSVTNDSQPCANAAAVLKHGGELNLTIKAFRHPRLSIECIWHEGHVTLWHRHPPHAPLIGRRHSWMHLEPCVTMRHHVIFNWWKLLSSPLSPPPLPPLHFSFTILEIHIFWPSSHFLVVSPFFHTSYHQLLKLSLV